LKGLSLQESRLVYPFLVKLKQYFKECADAHSGGFGGCCDACSSSISREDFYLVGGWARCDRCMDRVLYDNDNWYHYLGELEAWVGKTSWNLLSEAKGLQGEIKKLRV
jgi:hypothetical protein